LAPERQSEAEIRKADAGNFAEYSFCVFQGEERACMKATIHIDGASRGNPGLASCAAVIQVEGCAQRELAVFLGTTTNNVAEYSGLILALYEAQDMGAREVVIYSDSNLCVKQVRGEYKVTSENIIPLHRKVVSLLGRFEKWEINHIPREENQLADALSNRVLDLHKAISR